MGLLNKKSTQDKLKEPNDLKFWVIFAIAWAIAVGGTILGFVFKLI